MLVETTLDDIDQKIALTKVGRNNPSQHHPKNSINWKISWADVCRKIAQVYVSYKIVSADTRKNKYDQPTSIRKT